MGPPSWGLVFLRFVSTRLVAPENIFSDFESIRLDPGIVVLFEGSFILGHSDGRHLSPLIKEFQVESEFMFIRCYIWSLCSSGWEAYLCGYNGLRPIGEAERCFTG
jgi:hypothetical protein